MPRDNINIIFGAVLVVLIVTLYFHNKMTAMAHMDGRGGSRGSGGDLYLTNVEMGSGRGRGRGMGRGRRVSEVNLGQDNGRPQMKVMKTDPTGGMNDMGQRAVPYPDLNLPFQVIGGGHRMIPTYGGSQVPIANPTLPIDVSSANIAPVNIYQPDLTDSFRQVGVIMKVFGENNQMLPLFGREKWPNSNKWLYYTNAGKYRVSLPVKSAQHKGYEFELQDNDEVIIKGVPGKYRVTTYDTDSTDYIPINV